MRGALSLLLVASWACGSRSGMDGAGPAREQLAIAPEAPGELAPPEQRGCVDFTRSYNSVPPSVLLLIDQSQSMSFQFGDSTRWQVLRDAIVDPEQGLLASLDPSARIGLMLYTGRGGFNSPLGCPILTHVEAQFGNVPAVREAYLEAGPLIGGDTPTGESIAQAAAALAALGGSGPRYILLATDGEPDTCTQPKPSAGLPQALQAARDAFAQGIRVHVLGVSDGLGAWRLQQLANAGAGKPAELEYGVDADAEEPLSASSDPRELANQLRGIIGDARSCTVELGTVVGSERLLEGRLTLDGQQLNHDERDGWTFLDDETLRIHGAACDKILDDGERLQVRFPCTTDLAPPR